jgi:hypothetical protein
MHVFANGAPFGQPGRGSFTEKAMLGLIMMSVPLGIAVGLSALALTHADVDESAGCAGEEPQHAQSRRFHEDDHRRTRGKHHPDRLCLELWIGSQAAKLCHVPSHPVARDPQ